MMVDLHSLGIQSLEFHSFGLQNLELPCLCLLWKAAPGVLSSLGGLAQSQLLDLRRDSPALTAARISLMSFVADYTAKPRTAKQADGPARLDCRTPS
jgi:hypothetical protein